MKKFRESLRQHAVNKIKFENKKIIPLTNEQQELHEKTKICYICEFFFYLGFFHKHSRFTVQQGKGKGIFLTPLYHFQPFHRQLDIRRRLLQRDHLCAELAAVKKFLWSAKISGINTLMIEIIKELKTIVIILLKTEVLHTACVIWDAVYLNKFL